jgi:hypothetical protein
MSDIRPIEEAEDILKLYRKYSHGECVAKMYDLWQD